MCTARSVPHDLSPYITFWRCHLEVLQRPANFSRASPSSEDMNDLRSIRALNHLVQLRVKPKWFNSTLQTSGMAEDALIRLENLKSTGLGAAELARKVGSTYQYWRDLLAGRKSFGEKAARRIEEKLGFPRGSLDSVEFSPKAHPQVEPQTPAELSPGAVHLGRWLDKIKDADRRSRIAHVCMAIVLQELDGPHLQPTPEPDPGSRTPRAARQDR